MPDNFLKLKLGLITIEIVVALAVVTLSISATIFLIFGNQDSTTTGLLSEQALYKVQKLSETARAEARSDWNNLVSTSTTEGLFNLQMDVADTDDYVKSVTNLASVGSEKIKLSLILTNWLEILNQGICRVSSDSNWANPKIQNIIDLGIVASATDIDIKNNIGFITVNSPVQSKEDLIIVSNISSLSPSIIKRLNTGPGLVSIQVIGNFAYVANTSINGQLEVIDVSNPTNAFLRNTYKLPGSSSGDVATTLYYYDKKIYLGIPKSSGPEFHIIDVSNLDNIHEVGTWELNTKVNSIYVSNGKSYVATPDDEELKILDVHDPSSIKQIAGFNASGASGSGKSIARRLNRIFLGRNVGNTELYVLDLNNINSTALASQDINSSVNSLLSAGNLVFMATNDSTKEFQVWKLADNESSFNVQSSIDLPTKATSIDCENGSLYLTTEDASSGVVVVIPGP